jgi:hypothetical protein
MAASPNWVRQTDAQQSLSIGALEFDPTDASNQTLVAGIGRASSFLGDGGARTGLLRTTNGGATWTVVDGGGVLAGANIWGVAPRGNTIVIATTNQGIRRSTDGGATWTTISGAAGTGLPTGGSFDLASDPTNQARLFTNAGANGIFRSTDTGATWTLVSNAAMNTMMSGGLSNVDMSVGRNNNIYAAIVVGGTLGGVFRSGDGGTTWTQMDLPATVEGGIHPGGQGGTHLSIAADPNNQNIVYIGGDRQATPFPSSIGANDFSGRLFRGDASQPTGSQFVHLTHSSALGPAGGGTAGGTSPHADSRDMDVAANGVLIEGDDGGIYRRTNPQNDTGDWFTMNGNLLQPTEFHSAAWDAVSDIALGGAQDTGSPEQTATGNPRHRSISTADGGVVTVDDISTPGVSTRYSSNQNLGGFRRRTVDAANTVLSTVFPARTPLGGSPAMTPQFYTPIKVNNVTGTRIVFGAANGVYESLDQGDTVTRLAPVVVANGTGPHPIAYGAAGNPDMLYVGSGNRVFIRNAPPPAALAQSATYPGTGQIRGVAIDASQSLNAAVVDNTAVFRTADGGATWTTITGNLPTLNPGLFRSVAYSNATADGAVVVGTDRGVFIARGCSGFSAWQRLGTGLPNVPVFQLEYDVADRLLLAGTLGRGAWTLTFGPAGTAQVQVPGSVAFGDACVGSTRQATLNVCNTGKSDLNVDSIASSDPQFVVTTPSAGYPVVISPDFCFPFQVTLNAATAGPQSSKLTLATNDPTAACTTVEASANGTTPDIRVTGSTAFGVASAWGTNEKIVKVCNTGACNLAVASVSVTGTDFTLVSNPFAATVSPDSCLDVTVGFRPVLPGPRTADLTVASNDPDTPSVVRQLTGRSPPYFSIHAGAALPHGALNTTNDAGPTLNLAFTYPFLEHWAWDVRLGYAGFDGAAANPDVSVWTVFGNLKYVFNPAATLRVFANGGAGVFQFDPGGGEFGFNIGAGVQVPINRRFAVEGTCNFTTAVTATPSRRYSLIQGGLLVYF